MANVNVTLRRYNGSDWNDYIYPKTTIDQISDLTTVSENLLGLSNPSENVFVKIASNGTVSTINATTLKSASELDAADSGHNHTISDVTGLQTALDSKATLSNNKIQSTNIPDFLFGGLRFVSAVTTAPTLSTLYGNIDGSTASEKAGGYFVSTGTYSVTLGTGHIVAYGDDGDETSGGFTLEKGDWLVYTKYNSTTSNHEWAVVNNTYRVATSSSPGIASLSQGTITVRSGLSGTSSGDKVMDERQTKNVLKDIFYQSGTPSNGATGDLWFQGSF